ncbi:MAG: nitroreductase family deazaflavin-dependent oxidoreductase [Chloroflexi bacterium]|nr:MAG: nitroreductase family deazaflavin-dependent oxidoreductase [Chloroflexota bacterium]
MSLTHTQPRGLMKLLLHSPTRLYQLHLGWLLGERFMLLKHIGRTSRVMHETVIEVIGHNPQTDAYYAASGWGEKADWYQNLRHTPNATITVGRRTLDVRAMQVDSNAAAEILWEYAQKYPIAFRELSALLVEEKGEPTRESIARFAARIPVIEFKPRTNGR